MSNSKRSSSETTLQEETLSISPNSAGNKQEVNAAVEPCLPLTCNFADLPSWLQDNRDILRGYRRPTFSYIKCAKSLLYLHNETGTIAFIVIAFTTYFSTLSNTSSVKWWDFLVFYCFLAGAMACLSLSSLFHTFCCHSEKVCADWNRCDYIGIVALIVSIVVAIAPTFRSPEFRWFRTGLFLSMGLSAIFPIAHAIALYGFHLSFDVISLKYMLVMGLFYVAGAVIYGFRVPERWFPGKFDIWGSSHQIFHVFVVSAALVHYHGVMSAMSYWHERNHECKVDIQSMRPS
ncbi:10898_t:CDS:2 [Ambispora gerdemannii]|uniref:10898_t:CDS:1 n=1 Tax=Ambispora gerdemannii TaxID=144530 RepID=A0A9N8V9L3_9GLOM|nr:10898_t:CDS:2 [Ambispora gerdemannii]